MCIRLTSPGHRRLAQSAALRPRDHGSHSKGAFQLRPDKTPRHKDAAVATMPSQGTVQRPPPSRLAGKVASLDRAPAREDQLLSDEHFSVDGTLIEAWAGQKSFKRKGEAGSPPPADRGHPPVDFRGEKRSNETPQSTTDPEARLIKKTRGQEAKLNYLGHLLMENRHGLAVGVRLSLATGTAEPQAALEMLTQPQRPRRITVAADKKYDTHDFVAQARERKVTPQVAQNTERRGGSAIDGRTTRHPGYATSQRIRQRVEEIFGWLKTVGLRRKVRHRGRERVAWMLTWAVAVYDLGRICHLEKARAEAPA